MVAGLEVAVVAGLGVAVVADLGVDVAEASEEEEVEVVDVDSEVVPFFLVPQTFACLCRSMTIFILCCSLAGGK